MLSLNTFVEKELEQHAHMKHLPYKEYSYFMKYLFKKKIKNNYEYFPMHHLEQDRYQDIITSTINVFLTYLNIKHNQDHSNAE